MIKHFRCAACKREFGIITRTVDDVEAEFREMFPRTAAVDPDVPKVDVCTECYKQMLTEHPPAQWEAARYGVTLRRGDV